MNQDLFSLTLGVNFLLIAGANLAHSQKVDDFKIVLQIEDVGYCNGTHVSKEIQTLLECVSFYKITTQICISVTHNGFFVYVSQRLGAYWFNITIM